MIRSLLSFIFDLLIGFPISIVRGLWSIATSPRFVFVLAYAASMAWFAWTFVQAFIGG